MSWVGGAEWFGGRVGPMADHSHRDEIATDCRMDPMSDHWPLLVADPLDGERLVSSQLRPRAGAIAIGRHDYSAARQAVVELCGTRGGGGMPLIPVTAGESVDERWSRILNESNIDRIEPTVLLSDDEVRKYTDLHGPDTAQLVRIVVDLERKPAVQTCRGLCEYDPWHLAYLAVLGDLSPHPHRQNTWNTLVSAPTQRTACALSS